MIINIELSNNISATFPVSRLENGRQERCFITQDYNMVSVIRPGQHFSLVGGGNTGNREIKRGKIIAVDTVKEGVVLEI
jgi:hypothetical protein